MPGLVLLTPGPANTSARVRAALGRGDLCHREPEFGALLQSIRSGLVRALGVAATHEAIVVSGSGTSVMEMALTCSVREGRQVLVVSNGVYGDRFAAIAQAHRLPACHVRTAWTVPADPTDVARVLAVNPAVDAVVAVMHETSTGLLNPVADIGAVVRDSQAVFVVDAISATGHESPSLDQVGADVICGTANKGLHGVPGLAFLLASAKAVARFECAGPRSLYLDAAGYLRAEREGESPFTPAIQVGYALDEAIRELEDTGGYPARLAEYRARARVLRAGFDRLGLSILIDEPYRSNSVTALAVPAGVTYPSLHDELKRRGFVIYACQGPLRGSHFRVCNMGEPGPDALPAFLQELGDVLGGPAGR